MKNLLLALTCVALLSACKKKEEEVKPSNTALITAKSWRVTAKTTTYSGNGQSQTTDDFATSQPCERDNSTKFTTPNTVVIDEGATKCSTSDPQTTTGTWAFANNETQVVVAYPLTATVSYSLTFDIIELTATTMRLRYTDTTSQPPYTLVQNVTFTAF